MSPVISKGRVRRESSEAGCPKAVRPSAQAASRTPARIRRGENLTFRTLLKWPPVCNSWWLSVTARGDSLAFGPRPRPPRRLPDR